MQDGETPQERYGKSSNEELRRLVANAEFMVGGGNSDETVNRIAFESRAEFNRRARETPNA